MHPARVTYIALTAVAAVLALSVHWTPLESLEATRGSRDQEQAAGVITVGPWSTDVNDIPRSLSSFDLPAADDLRWLGPLLALASLAVVGLPALGWRSPRGWLAVAAVAALVVFVVIYGRTMAAANALAYEWCASLQVVGGRPTGGSCTRQGTLAFLYFLVIWPLLAAAAIAALFIRPQSAMPAMPSLPDQHDS